MCLLAIWVIGIPVAFAKIWRKVEMLADTGCDCWQGELSILAGLFAIHISLYIGAIVLLAVLWPTIFITRLIRWLQYRKYDRCPNCGDPIFPGRV
jgi:hypothetical protein